MTGKITDERLAEIAAEYGEMAGNLTGALKDGPGASSTFYMSCSLGEIAGMAREIQTLRSAQAGEVEVAGILVWNSDRDELEIFFYEGTKCSEGDELITLASHTTVIAAKDAEIERLTRERDAARMRAAAWAKEEGQRQIELGAAEARANAAVGVLNEAFDFLGGVNGASEIRGKILTTLNGAKPDKQKTWGEWEREQQERGR